MLGGLQAVFLGSVSMPPKKSSTPCKKSAANLDDSIEDDEYETDNQPEKQKQQRTCSL